MAEIPSSESVSTKQERIARLARQMPGVGLTSLSHPIDPAELRQMVGQRVRDGVLLRLIGKWLKAGVLEEGCIYHPETGTPQGGVISPLLANIYLHEVLDLWWESEVLARLRGRAALIRYADDFVMVFETEVDARRCSTSTGL